MSASESQKWSIKDPGRTDKLDERGQVRAESSKAHLFRRLEFVAHNLVLFGAHIAPRQVLGLRNPFALPASTSKARFRSAKHCEA